MHSVKNLALMLLLIMSCSFAEETPKVNGTSRSKYVIPTRQPWNNPPSIVFYSHEFADRLGLDDAHIIQFEPALTAIQVHFERTFDFDYLSKSPFVSKYYLDTLTPEQRDMVDTHLSALPILFPDEKMPIYVHYDCYINLYLKTDDARVKNIQLPDRPIWWDHKMNARIIYNMLTPIQMYQVAAADDPDLKSVPNNKAKRLIANYYSYLDKALSAPKAVLTQGKTNLANPQQRVLLTFNGHYKNFLPGLHYLSFKIPYCDLLDQKENSKRTWIWVQKTVNKNEPLKLRYDSTQFYAFRIPPDVLRTPIMKKIYEFNSRSLAGRRGSI